MEYEIGHFSQSQQTVAMMKELFTCLLILLFFSSCFCQIKEEQKNQKKTLIVKHNTKRWEIKTADDGTYKKGKDYWHYYRGEYDDLPLSTPLKPEIKGYLEFLRLGNPMTISNALLLHKLLATGKGEQVVRRKGELNRHLVTASIAASAWRGDTVSKVRCRVYLRFRLKMKFFD